MAEDASGAAPGGWPLAAAGAACPLALQKRASVAGSAGAGAGRPPALELDFSLAAAKAKAVEAMRKRAAALVPGAAAAAAAPPAFLRFADSLLFDRLLGGLALMFAARFQREALARHAERTRAQQLDGACAAAGGGGGGGGGSGAPPFCLLRASVPALRLSHPLLTCAAPHRRRTCAPPPPPRPPAYSQGLITARLAELEAEEAGHRAALSRPYAEVVLRYSSYRKPQRDRCATGRAGRHRRVGLGGWV
jgi:hypothetical protein